MLDSAAPLEQRPPVNVLPVTLHRPVAELVEHPDRRAAEVGAGLVAAVAGERRVDDREPAAAHEHRASPAALLERTGGVAAGEGEVAQHQLGRGLVLAVRGGPGQPLVAGVLVEDPVLAAAAERDQATAVDDDLARGVVVHLGLPVHDDRDRVGAAVEGDGAALRDRLAERRGGAARGRAVADHAGSRARCGATWCAAYDGTGVSRAATRPPRTAKRAGHAVRLGARRAPLGGVGAAARSTASASRASALSAALWPELQTPVESRSMVLTLRGATGLET